MSHIASLYLKNWMRFKGEHHIKLRPSIYALTARMENDDERSNWLGKSATLAAIRFALTGTRPKQHVHEDDWVTWGEKEGAVGIRLDDGFGIIREHKIGSSTQLKVVDAEGKVANQDAAQEVIDRVIGLVEDDLMATCIFEQKKMGRVITSTPGDRMDMVTPWFDLEPVQRCEDNAQKKLAALTKEDADAAARSSTCDELVTETLERVGTECVGDALEDEKKLPDLVERLKDERDDLKSKMSKAQKKADDHAANLAHMDKADEYDELAEKGKREKKRLDQYDVEAMSTDIDERRKLKDDASSKLGAGNAELAKLKVVAQGDFDGKCPVASIECPAKSKINGDRKNARKRYDDAKKELTKLQKQFDELAARLDDDEDELDEMLALKTRLDEWRQRVKALKPSHDLVQSKGPFDRKKLDELREKVDDAASKYNDAEVKYRTAIDGADSIAKWRKEQSELMVKRDLLKPQIATAREALVIVGRNGAQKQIAETALTEIQIGANKLLRDSGIDLTIEVKWGREGKKLATYCTSCGAPFPTSQRVKECGQCGSKRGPKIVERLDIELSEYSGAAEDLAGIAFQLSASAWLRARRASPWSVAIIDEPFGALDPANKRALATHFVAMLQGQYGFKQAFVVAHDKGIMDALPSQLRVVADDEASKLEVES